MKMKQVMTQTGLSARTIRYYEAQGLFAPRVEQVNGRRNRDYTPEDVACLKAIASLRRARFSLEEIRKMLEQPEQTPAVFAAYHIRLEEEQTQLEDLLQCAGTINPEDLGDAYDLAERLAAPARKLPLPRRDVTPHFARYDPDLPEPKQPDVWDRLRRSGKLAEAGVSTGDHRQALPLTAREMLLREAAVLAEDVKADRDAPASWSKPGKAWPRRRKRAFRWALGAWLAVVLALLGIYLVRQSRAATGFIQQSGYNTRHIFSDTYRQDLEAWGVDLTVAGTGGQPLTFTLPADTALQGLTPADTPIPLLTRGTRVRCDFVTWTDKSRSRSRWVTLEADGQTLHQMVRTRDLSRWYLSALEQNGLTEAFELQTGEKLTPASARRALQTIDAQIHALGIYRPAGYPYDPADLAWTLFWAGLGSLAAALALAVFLGREKTP